MSGLVEKVLEKTRGRSRSRKSSLRNPDRPAAPELGGDATADRIGSQELSRTTVPSMASPPMPAWHVHAGARPANPDPTSPSTGRRRGEHSPPTTTYVSPQQPNQQHALQQNTGAEQIPARSSSLRPRLSGSEYANPEGQPANGVSYPHTVARRRQSGSQEKKQHRNSRSIGGKVGQEVSGAHRPATAPQPTFDVAGQLPSQAVGSDLSTEIDQALASLSVQDRAAQPVSTPAQSQVQTSGPASHLQLPQGFNVGNSERTYIDTEWKPAVTHENVHHDTTEIIREAVTRDIHVHHYYTYVQPIKVVEILPAKHYRLDERTGIKTEIPAPEGWVMPEHLTPRHQDTSNVKAWTRHYLVNEQYPYGTPEPPSQPPRLPDAGQNVDLSDSVLRKYQPLRPIESVPAEQQLPQPTSGRTQALPQQSQGQYSHGNTANTRRPVSQSAQQNTARRNYSVSHPMLNQYVHRAG